MTNRMFRKLTEDELAEFTQAARAEYTPGKTVNPIWHPAYRMECERMNLEQVQTQTPLTPEETQAAIADILTGQDADEAKNNADKRFPFEQDTE